MRAFASIPEFQAFLDRRVAAFEGGFLSVFAEIGAMIRRDARDRLGVYHAQDGPFPRWRMLADSTQTERERLGYSPDEPLLRDGTLRASIHEMALPWAVAVGVERGATDSQGTPLGDIAMWQEFGAARLGVPHIPPRPFLGPALYNNIQESVAMLTEAAFHRLTAYEAPGAIISRVPARIMSEEVFDYGRALTGGTR